MIKKERVNINTLSLPDELIEWIDNASVYESSGQSGARTVYIDRDGGSYLKIAARESLLLASQMQTYLSKHKMTSPVLKYLSTDRDYMITAPLKGDDGTAEKYLAEPELLSEIFGQSLRLLHEVDISDCPIKDRMSGLIQLVGTTSFLQTHLDDIAVYIGKARADKSLAEIVAKCRLLKNDVFMHGEYSLPNIILNNWAFEGFIDVADGGVGDRHYDLAWGLRTLNWNLKTSKYSRRFLDAYGWVCIDKERLRICGLLAAME